VEEVLETGSAFKSKNGNKQAKEKVVTEESKKGMLLD
jgi:hypothetical protein